MSDIIKITYDGKGPIVSGRELHRALEVESNYTTWFARMIEFGFSEGTDYATCFPNLESEMHGGQNKQDHAVTIEMAKHIAMVQRSPAGTRAREYFIQVEKDFNSPEKTIARALLMAAEEIKVLKPKGEFYDAVTASPDWESMDVVAKVLNLGYGRNTLFAKLRDLGILDGDNYPYQQYVDRGYFRLIEQQGWKDRGGNWHPTYKTLVSQRGMDFIRRTVAKPLQLVN